MSAHISAVALSPVSEKREGVSVKSALTAVTHWDQTRQTLKFMVAGVEFFG